VETAIASAMDRIATHSLKFDYISLRTDPPNPFE